MPAPTSVDDYLAALPAERRAVLESLRRTIRAAAPDAIESIAYAMPAYRTADGQFVVSFGAYKRHDSLFPASGAVVAALGEDVAPYLAAKSTFQFPVGRPIPLALITRIVNARLREIGERSGERAAAGAGRGARPRS